MANGPELFKKSIQKANISATLKWLIGNGQKKKRIALFFLDINIFTNARICVLLCGKHLQQLHM